MFTEFIKFHSQILALLKAPQYQNKPTQPCNKYVSNGTWSIERFVGLESGISLMHEVLMQTIRPLSWDMREMGSWVYVPRELRIQSWKSWLCISRTKERYTLKHHLVHSKIPSFHKDLLLVITDQEIC